MKRLLATLDVFPLEVARIGANYVPTHDCDSCYIAGCLIFRVGSSVAWQVQQVKRDPQRAHLNVIHTHCTCCEVKCTQNGENDTCDASVCKLCGIRCSNPTCSTDGFMHRKCAKKCAKCGKYYCRACVTAPCGDSTHYERDRTYCVNCLLTCENCSRRGVGCDDCGLHFESCWNCESIVCNQETCKIDLEEREFRHRCVLCTIVCDVCKCGFARNCKQQTCSRCQKLVCDTCCDWSCQQCVTALPFDYYDNLCSRCAKDVHEFASPKMLSFSQTCSQADNYHNGNNKDKVCSVCCEMYHMLQESQATDATSRKRGREKSVVYSSSSSSSSSSLCVAESLAPSSSSAESLELVSSVSSFSPKRVMRRESSLGGDSAARGE